MVVPLVRRERSEDTELDAPAPEILWVDGEAGGIRCDKELFSFPFCSKLCLSVLVRSVHTYVFLRVMALEGMLFVVTLTSLRRSGISALLGLLAALTIGLDGGILRLPTTLPLVLREGRRSSFRSPSPAVVGLRLGWATGTDGPQKSLCLLCRW